MQNRSKTQTKQDKYIVRVEHTKRFVFYLCEEENCSKFPKWVLYRLSVGYLGYAFTRIVNRCEWCAETSEWVNLSVDIRLAMVSHWWMYKLLNVRRSSILTIKICNDSFAMASSAPPIHMVSYHVVLCCGGGGCCSAQQLRLAKVM